MGMIDLPIGTQFKTIVDDEFVTVVVAKGIGCSRCVYSDGSFVCKDIACGASERTDGINVVIKKLEGGEND